METCLGFHIDCGVLAKGAGVVIVGAILFMGSVYLVLTAVLGRWLGYLVLMVSLSGWLIARFGYTPVFIGYGVMPLIALALVLFGIGPLRPGVFRREHAAG